MTWSFWARQITEPRCWFLEQQENRRENMNDMHRERPEPTTITFMRQVRDNWQPVFASRAQIIEILDYVDHLKAQVQHLEKEKNRLLAGPRPKRSAS